MKQNTVMKIFQNKTKAIKSNTSYLHLSLLLFSKSFSSLHFLCLSICCTNCRSACLDSKPLLPFLQFLVLFHLLSSRRNVHTKSFCPLLQLIYVHSRFTVCKDTWRRTFSISG